MLSCLNCATISLITTCGTDFPAKCIALLRMMNAAMLPNKIPIKTEPMESGILVLNTQLNAIDEAEMNVPKIDAESSKQTTLKLGSALVLTENGILKHKLLAKTFEDEDLKKYYPKRGKIN
ncbi:unnamed protein product [Cercopithifilaria johnstoni]|uniref:Uncharacterized protein n=1 Tax=Cercopithifilaria johnstoni TaxID=2874296 RepID=A0A8J2PRK3_9BILA|nr:unnamed protein product [Cercopithifilaria johnstoni]